MTEKPKFSPYLKYPIVDEKDLELALSKAKREGELIGMRNQHEIEKKEIDRLEGTLNCATHTFSHKLKTCCVEAEILQLEEQLKDAKEQGKLDPIKLVEKIISEMDKEEYWESVLLEDGEDRRLFDSYHFESWLKSQIKKQGAK
jgi:hypothetical protein